MSRKKHTLDEVIRSLSKKNDCQILAGEKIVLTKKNSQDLGNGSWGKIDFLSHHCGFKHVEVKDFSDFLGVAPKKKNVRH